jgi:tripartite-type tricarboxylate transporter receptor subunit TctC
MALPLVAPPGIPADRAAALREAFQQMVVDKAFLDEAQKLGLEISPITGEAVRSLLERSQKTPKDVIERYRKIAGES